jgi:hypothetical protein
MSRGTTPTRGEGKKAPRGGANGGAATVAGLSVNGRSFHFRQTCSRSVECSGSPSVNLTVPPQTGR